MEMENNPEADKLKPEEVDDDRSKSPALLKKTKEAEKKLKDL